MPIKLIVPDEVAAQTCMEKTVQKEAIFIKLFTFLPDEFALTDAVLVVTICGK